MKWTAFRLLLLICAGCLAVTGCIAVRTTVVVTVIPVGLSTDAPAATTTPATPHIVTLRPAATRTPTFLPNTPTPTPITPTVAPTVECDPAFDPIAFFPDGKRLLGVVTQIDGQAWVSTAQVRDVETLQIEDEIPAPFMVQKAALSPDGQTLAWGLEDYSIRLVRLSDHQETAFMEGHIRMITGLKFSPSGDRLYSASHDGTVRVWGTDGRPGNVLQPGGEIVGMGLSRDGGQLATIPLEGNTVLWDAEKGRKLKEFEGAIFGGYDGSEAVFSPDGQYFAHSLGAGGAASLWRLSDGELLWRGGTFAVAFSPDSSIFAHSDWDAQQNSLIVLRSSDGQQVLHTLSGHPGMVWRLVFSPDSQTLASFDGSVFKLWQVDTGELLYTSLPACLH